MILAVREIERLESRALAALRFIDAASRLAVEATLQLTPPAGAQITRNRSGLHVIRSFPALASHSDSFVTPPADPAIGSVPFTVSVRDPAGIYLERSVQIALPRDPSPENATAANSLFRPIDVELYHSPAAPLGANWAAVRLSVTDDDSGDALAGALIRIRNTENVVLARGLTDWRGEALVPVVGVPITTWSDDEDAVVVTEIDATLQISFDAAGGSRRVTPAQLSASTPPAGLPAPDPAAIEASAAATSTEMPIRLAAGRALVLALTLELPG